MGLIIGGSLVSIVLADLIAFYALSAVFAYSYETAWQVAYGSFFYVLLAWMLFLTDDRIASYQQAWLGRLHGLVSKSLWWGLCMVLLACVLLNIAGNFTAHSSTRYVEVSGTWVWQSTKSYFMGSDFYSKPVPQRSPVLRDIESNETFYVIDQTDQALGYTLIANRGIDRKALTCGYCPSPYSVRHARVQLKSTFFGKHSIADIEYVDFESLPVAVQESAIRRLSDSRSAVIALSRLGNQHPALRDLVDKSLIAASNAGR
jgi:hypothetical protein